MVMIRVSDCVLLEKRPPNGIWGGLWSLPEVETGEAVEPILLTRYGMHASITGRWKVMRHGFTHFNLDITPVEARVNEQAPRIMENTDVVWYNLNKPDARGLAAPVKKLLDKLR